MLPYARLAPGPGFQPGRALFYYAQRLVTAQAPRRAVSSLVAAAVRRSHGDGRQDHALDPADRRALAALRREGVAVMQPLAPDAAIARMAAYFRERTVIGPEGERRLFDELPPRTAFASYDLQTVLDCPGIVELVNSSSVLRIAADYLGCKPTLSSLGVRWSFPSGEPRPRFQSFHRDVDDWRFLKLFVYLTDVCPHSGPHAYARGSHRTGFGLRARAYDPLDVEARYGPGRVLTITGPRGTTFMADTIGIHRGGAPVTRPRLILQAQYSILPVFAFRYEPVDAGARRVDAYSNRLLLRGGAAAQAS